MSLLEEVLISPNISEMMDDFDKMDKTKSGENTMQNTMTKSMHDHK